jgi:NADP-dependent 3-hydroxy acid dehydrogenase YdfG
MQPIKDKIALITGASSGIGYACAKIFAKNGAKLILAARRDERLKSLAAELKKKYKTDIFALKLDVRSYRAVERATKGLPAKWKKIDILVNNAGLSRGLDKIYEGKIIDWDEMIDTNVKGLLYVSRAVIPGMVERDSGHIVNIGSIAGFDVYPKGNVYCASKYAVRGITKGMRIDLNGTNVKVTAINPGLVETEFSLVRYRGDKDKAGATYKGLKALTGDDVADAVYYAVTRSPNVVVAEMLVLPLPQATTTIVHRKS